MVLHLILKIAHICGITFNNKCKPVFLLERSLREVASSESETKIFCVFERQSYLPTVPDVVRTLLSLSTHSGDLVFSTRRTTESRNIVIWVRRQASVYGGP